MTLEDSIHSQRLRVLRDAERLGNVSEACRRHGMSRTLFYRLRQRLEAVRAGWRASQAPPGARGRPPAVPVQTERRVIAVGVGVAHLRPAVVQRPARPRGRGDRAGDDLALAAPPAAGHAARAAGGAWSSAAPPRPAC